MKITKKQTGELFNCHVGVGFLAYKQSDNSLVCTEFFINQKTKQPCHIKDGSPIQFITEED
jgi:hypothetical protein